LIKKISGGDLLTTRNLYNNSKTIRSQTSLIFFSNQWLNVLPIDSLDHIVFLETPNSFIPNYYNSSDNVSREHGLNYIDSSIDKFIEQYDVQNCFVNLVFNHFDEEFSYPNSTNVYEKYVKSTKSELEIMDENDSSFISSGYNNLDLNLYFEKSNEEFMTFSQIKDVFKYKPYMSDKLISSLLFN
jgi:hypothetical protein